MRSYGAQDVGEKSFDVDEFPILDLDTSLPLDKECAVERKLCIRTRLTRFALIQFGRTEALSFGRSLRGIAADTGTNRPGWPLSPGSGTVCAVCLAAKFAEPCFALKICFRFDPVFRCFG